MNLDGLGTPRATVGTSATTEWKADGDLEGAGKWNASFYGGEGRRAPLRSHRHVRC